LEVFYCCTYRSGTQTTHAVRARCQAAITGWHLSSGQRLWNINKSVEYGKRRIAITIPAPVVINSSGRLTKIKILLHNKHRAQKAARQ